MYSLIERHFANVLLPLAHAENAMHLESNILCFYKNVSTDSKLMDASSEVQKLLNDFAIETPIREDLYQPVDAVLNKHEDIDPESHHLLEKQHTWDIRNGLNVPARAKRDRFKEIQKRLSQPSIDFRKNQNEENVGAWFLPEELDGVPEDVFSGLEKGTQENKGKLWLNFDFPHCVPAMQYARNSETRKIYFTASQRQNLPIFKEIVVLRDEAARLLGYPNHAAFRIEEKMAGTPETVKVFMEDLRVRI